MSRRYPTDSSTSKSLASARSPVRRDILFTIGILLALALAWRLRDTLTLVYISALFAVVLTPVVNSIVRFETRGGRHITRGAAIALLFSLALLVLTLFFTLGLPPVIHDLHQFASDLPNRIPATVARLKHLPYASQLGVDAVAEKIEGAVSATASYLVTQFPHWMGHIFDVIMAFILCIYFMLEGDRAYAWFMSFIPIPSRLRLAVTLERAEHRMSRWLFGQATLMLILGTASTVVFGLLHVRYFFLLGVLMGLFNIIPVIGAIITVSLSCVVAALDSWTKMGGVLIFYVIYANIENAYLTPRIMGSSVNLMGLTVLIALLAGTELAGIPGALVSVPTAALLAVLINEYLLQKDQP